MAETTTLPPFQVTPAAIRAIESLGGGVRLRLAQGGCCGTAYDFQLVDAEVVRLPGETWFGCPGAWLVVTPDALEVMTGARLDYGASLRPPRFRVTRNPNTEHVCACRRSFGREWPGPGQPTCWAYRPMEWDDDFEPPTAWQRRTGWGRQGQARQV